MESLNQAKDIEEFTETNSNQEIVVVDDDEDFVSLLRMEAGIRGITLSHFKDAKSALKSWNKDASGYLIDWDLPGISGMDLIQEVHPSQRDKMVLMSSLVLPGVRERARSLGYQKCVEKTFAAGCLLDGLGSPGKTENIVH